LEALRAERLREREQRISRRRLLTGAAAVGGMALLAGVGLVGRDAVSGANTRLRDDGWTDDGSGSGGNVSSAPSGSTGGSSSTQVVVAQSACVACGRCLQVCPRGVFDWSSSGRAEASSPDACIRCGRCLQACPAGVITISA
jgi:NAD-dependent dihydropyrimidine dehydrogenase PreA subunit